MPNTDDDATLPATIGRICCMHTMRPKSEQNYCANAVIDYPTEALAENRSGNVLNATDIFNRSRSVVFTGLFIHTSATDV